MLQGTATSGYAYTGREWDPETGLYYYRARYYHPLTARFITEDPLGLRAGTNLYVYVKNAPIVFRDPSGRDIYYLIDWQGGGRGGHGAVLIGKNDHFTYHSFASRNRVPAGEGAYTTARFESLSDAMKHAASLDYDDYLKYCASEERDELARGAADAYGSANYNVTGRNCQQLVNDVMWAARVVFDGRAQPSLTFKINAPAADGGGKVE
jgi:RHS repeat-associated protein